MHRYVKRGEPVLQTWSDVNCPGQTHGTRRHVFVLGNWIEGGAVLVRFLFFHSVWL